MLANAALEVDACGESLQLCIDADLSAALHHAEDDLLFRPGPTRHGSYRARFASVHIAGLAADESFVNFDFAGRVSQSRFPAWQGESDGA